MKRDVILLEINEITWSLIDPFIEQGKLPYFAKLKNEGAWASPMSVDLPPQLDPWITWTTVYTGQPQAAHNVFHLQQPPESITAKRIWDICHDAGLKVGVYGSLCSYPPKDVGGFFIPDTFSPDVNTFPEELRPVQELNLTYTRSARLDSDSDGLVAKGKLGADLIRLGLSFGTVTKLAKQLGGERIDPHSRWKRVALQPAVNFDIFSMLYKKYRPNLAMFHTNHVAHYQHTYWKAMQPDVFPQRTDDTERERYSRAIEYGYKTADALIGKTLGLCGEHTVLVIASSMGQQPYISELSTGKRIGQMRSLEQLAKLIGADSSVEFLPVMSDQFNIYCKDNGMLENVKNTLTGVYVEDPSKPMYHVAELDGFLTVTLNHFEDLDDKSLCTFRLWNGTETAVKYSDLVHRTGIVKSGCHHPQGMLIIRGKDISSGHVGESNNLDIAPTILSLLGVEIPSSMTGRVLI